jgi:hypothetical protein
LAARIGNQGECDRRVPPAVEGLLPPLEPLQVAPDPIGERFVHGRAGYRIARENPGRGGPATFRPPPAKLPTA